MPCQFACLFQWLFAGASEGDRSSSFFGVIGSRVSSCAPYQFGVFQFDDLLGIVSVQLNAFLCLFSSWR